MLTVGRTVLQHEQIIVAIIMLQLFTRRSYEIKNDFNSLAWLAGRSMCSKSNYLCSYRQYICPTSSRHIAPCAPRWQCNDALLGNRRNRRGIHTVRIFNSGDFSTVQNILPSQQSFHIDSNTLHFHNVLVVIKQTAYEEYSQV
jgi:hypothetical protein